MEHIPKRIAKGKENEHTQKSLLVKCRSAAVFGIALLSGLHAFGATATGIKRPQTGETVEVLVQYATQPTAEQHQRVTDHNGRIRAIFETCPWPTTT